MRDEASIKRQLHKEESFKPAYCPNTKCKNHFPQNARSGFFKKHSVKKIKRFPYLSYRYQCRDCDKTFSASFFWLHYRQKVWGLNEKISMLHEHGVSKRAIARLVSHNERLVRDRLIKMARWSLLMHAKLTKDLKIEEPIVYDGLENFSFSQYDPNNINHAVGKNSLFTYDFNFCPINRKGRMSEAQKTKKHALEKQYGAYPRDSIRSTTRRVFERLLDRADAKLTIFSDRHFQYSRVVEEDLIDERIEHFKVSSKIHRNFKNHLFAVNNIDVQARHNLAAFKRETIAFSKHSVAMVESFVLYMVHRNYMRPKYWGTHRSDPLSSKRSPAMELGIAKEIYSFKDFYKIRTMPTHVMLNKDASELYYRIDPYSRRPIKMMA